MKRSTRIISALLLALFTVPVFAQVTDTYVIPAAINQAGAFGTRWKTQISIFNPQLEHDLTVRVVFIPTGGGTGLTARVPVGRNSIKYSDNILDDLFDRTGSGALLAATFAEDNPGVPNTTLDQSFLITTNTYNDSASGTYGQTIPGIWTGLQDYTNEGISGVVHGIRNSRLEGWRTNIGFVNLGRCSPVVVRVNVYDQDGRTIVEQAPFSLPFMAHLQGSIEDLRGKRGESIIELNRGTLEFFVDDPCANNPDNAAVVFAYTSTVDQLSGDPTYQTPVLLADPKSIYSKKAAAAGDFAAAQLSIGKRVSKATVKAIADQAVDVGTVQLRSGSQRIIR